MTSTIHSRPSSSSTRIACTRSHCAYWATRATRRRRPRTPWCAPIAPWPGTTRHGSASCDSVHGSPRSCSICVARDWVVARRRGRQWRGPAETAATRDAAGDWAGLLLTLPPAYRSAVVLRHVDGLTYPEVAAALERPEGTVKAQVHRGVALLRTAFEAAERRDREEMTA